MKSRTVTDKTLSHPYVLDARLMALQVMCGWEVTANSAVEMEIESFARKFIALALRNPGPKPDFQPPTGYSSGWWDRWSDMTLKVLGEAGGYQLWESEAARIRGQFPRRVHQSDYSDYLLLALGTTAAQVARMIHLGLSPDLLELNARTNMTREPTYPMRAGAMIRAWEAAEAA